MYDSLHALQYDASQLMCEYSCIVLCCAVLCCYYCEQVGAAFGEACVDQGAAVMAQSQLQRLYWEQHMQAQQMQRGALAALQQRQQFQFQVSTVSTITTIRCTCYG
jgi:hypothetical protein